MKTQAAIESQDAVLEIRDLTLCFGTPTHPLPVVKGLNLDVKRGKTLAIVGESGSGKSITSLSVMKLLEHQGGFIQGGRIDFCRPNGGKVDVARASEKTMRSIRGAEISMIFQEPMTSLNPVLTIGHQLTETLRLHRSQSKSAALAEAMALLEQVRIPNAANILMRYPHELSGGMRQRIVIAMAIACKPALLIADEPTTALDVTIQAQILQLLKDLQREMNMGVIFITHDMGVVAEIADEVLVMRRGEVVERNNVVELFEAPQHPYTRSLMAAVPKLGSMRGTDLPAPFDLINEVDNRTPPRTAFEDRSAGETSTLLEICGLEARFDLKGSLFAIRQRVHAVERVNLQIRQGETLSIVGESGCGKSTLGRTLLGLNSATGGHLVFEGRKIDLTRRDDLSFIRRNVQFVFQDPFASLNPRLTVLDAVREPLLIHGIATPAEASKRATALLERVGLKEADGSRFPHEFSGGQRQRICIARALSVNPRLLIADEAVSALDVSIQAQIVNLMQELQAELGISYLFISHDMAVVERISHRVAVMYLGQIVELGTRRRIFENPSHPYTKRLLSAVPIPDPRLRRERSLELTEIPSAVRPVGYKPEIRPYAEVYPGHLVATHAVGGLQFNNH